jgi:hypothetical protein
MPREMTNHDADSSPGMPPRPSRSRALDLRTIREASSLIAELGAELDRKLLHEGRPEERLRMLRETTNRITRAANDGVQAYVRATRSLTAEQAGPRAHAASAAKTRRELSAARDELLRVLDVAGRRYPSAEVDGELARDADKGATTTPNDT